MEVQLPFPTLNWGEQQYKLFGVVTNRDLAGDKLIWWSRERCGKGEEMHAIMKMTWQVDICPQPISEPMRPGGRS